MAGRTATPDEIETTINGVTNSWGWVRDLFDKHMPARTTSVVLTGQYVRSLRLGNGAWL